MLKIRIDPGILVNSILLRNTLYELPVGQDLKLDWNSAADMNTSYSVPAQLVFGSSVSENEQILHKNILLSSGVDIDKIIV